jgi:hypothetical protein
MIGPFAFGIPLRGRGGVIRGFALIDLDDRAEFSQYRWSLTGKGYAARYPAHGVTVYLHRELLGLRAGERWQGDHVNGDKLDNRRANLQVVSPEHNRQNQHSRQGATSAHRGVHFRDGQWIAQVYVKRKAVFYGTFGTEAEAADAAAAARAKYQPNSADARNATERSA